MDYWFGGAVSDSSSFLHSSPGKLPHTEQATPSSCNMGFFEAQPPLNSPFFTSKTLASMPSMARLKITSAVIKKVTLQRYGNSPGFLRLIWSCGRGIG
jgi:hypothetical protein